MSYTYKEIQRRRFGVSLGGVFLRSSKDWNVLDVSVRVGSSVLDNTRKLKNAKNDYSSKVTAVPSIKGDGAAFSNAVWLATQKRWKTPSNLTGAYRPTCRPLPSVWTIRPISLSPRRLLTAGRKPPPVLIGKSWKACLLKFPAR